VKLRVHLRAQTHAEVSFTPSSSDPKSLQVEVALLGGNIESDVKRGENHGRKLRHEFVVLHLATAGMSMIDGHFAASLTLPSRSPDAPNAVAAWVVAGDSQPPIQTTGGWLKTP
jgi:hypothetical protein